QRRAVRRELRLQGYARTLALHGDHTRVRAADHRQVNGQVEPTHSSAASRSSASKFRYSPRDVLPIAFMIDVTPFEPPTTAQRRMWDRAWSWPSSIVSSETRDQSTSPSSEAMTSRSIVS